MNQENCRLDGEPSHVHRRSARRLRSRPPFHIAGAACALLLGGCASVTPTREVTQSVAIYDIKPSPGMSHGKAVESLKTPLQKNMSAVHVTTGIPPSPLPDTAPRIQLVSPFKAGSQMAALAAASGQVVQVPVCEGAIATAQAQNSSYAKYGEATTFFACLVPYKDGYGLNIYTSYAKTSGAVSAATLGATVARSVVGDSSQFIARTTNDIVQSYRTAGATVTLIESYP